MGKVLRIIYCEICKQPTHKKTRHFTRTSRRPLCRDCWRRYGDTFSWGRWP